MKNLLITTVILWASLLLMPKTTQAQCNLLAVEQFTTSANFSTTSSGTTAKYWSPSTCTTGGLLYYSSGGCTGGYIGKTGAWNDHFWCFLRSPQANCTGNTYVTLNFDISNSYFSTHPNDKTKFYMWVDGGYKKASQVKIGGIDVGFTDMNGLWLKFDEERICVNVDVVFDLTSCSNLSDILFYIEPKCEYNDSKVFSVVLDNISLNGSPQQANAGADDTICAGSSVQLNASGGTSYLWSPSTGLSATTIANPIASPTITTTYVVTATGACGSATDAVVITVNPAPATPVITQTGSTLFSNTPSGNQWYNSSGPISGATGNSYKPPLEGNYYVIVTDNNGCQSDTSNVIYLSVTEIQSSVYDKQQLIIYPNPAKDKITIANNAESNIAVIFIYDTQGRMLLKLSLKKGGNEIDISHFAQGIYLIKLESDIGIAVQKFIKE